MALRENDIGVVINFDVLEDISDATELKLIFRNTESGTVQERVAALSGSQIVTYTTVAGDLNREGDWDVQAYVVQPTKTRRSVVDTLTVQDAIDS